MAVGRELTYKVYGQTKKAEFQDVYDHAGRTRAAIGGFIKYLLVSKQAQRKKGNPEPLNSEPRTLNL